MKCLHLSAQAGSRQCVELLASRGVNLNVKDYRRTAMECALMNHHPDVAEVRVMCFVLCASLLWKRSKRERDCESEKRDKDRAYVCMYVYVCVCMCVCVCV